MIARALIALVVLLIGVAAVLVYRGEWIRQEADLGYGEAAFNDSFLAARQFLSRHGVRTRKQGELLVGIQYPSSAGTVLFSGPRLALNDADEARLLAWVHAGGSLITVASHPDDLTLFGRRDRLDDRLGVSSRERNFDATPQHARDLEQYDRDGCLVRPHERIVGEAALRGLVMAADGVLRLEVQQSARSTALAYAADDHGRLLHRVRLGNGTVTYVADSSLWANWRVGCLDHAHVLLGLLGTSRQLLIVDVARQATVADLLWRHGKALLGALALLLGFWLWHIVPRFGPLLPPPPLVRRERLDALRAHGRYLWQRRAVGPLLDGLRRLTRTSARRRIGQDDAIDALARRAGVPLDAARAAIATTPRHEGDVIATTNTLLELIDCR